MRVRNAGAIARLLMIAVLITGTVLSGVPAVGAPTPAPSGAVESPTASQNKQPGKINRKDRKAKSGNDKDTKAKKSQGQGKANGKRNRGKRAPAALKANRIAAEKADTLEALECGDLIALRVNGRTFCTHGEDPQPPSADPASTDDSIGAESEEPASGRAARALCLDDGVSGPRVQMVYVHRNDRPNRLNELLPAFRRLASEMDIVFDQSARKTGDSLRVRYVTNDDCKVDIQHLSVPPKALDGFGSLIQKMDEAGHDALDRKYLMMVDASVFCGVGTFAGGSNADDTDTEAHDFTGYARVDLPCWDAGSMAHELSHTLGAVQNSAPNTSRGGHCIDEWDVMCYSDEPFKPKMTFVCDAGSNDFRLDCGNNDYFAARPVRGSYLDRHWNSAASQYLTPGTEHVCVDAAFEPDDAFWYDYWKVPMSPFPLGQRQNRAFCDEPGDTDWSLIRAKQGTTYHIETTDLAAGVDTQLVLYRGFEEQRWDGMEQVAANDDHIEGDPASAITFTAPADVTFLVGVAEATEQAGRDRTYSLSIARVGTTALPGMSLSRESAKPGTHVTVTVRDLAPGDVAAIRRQRNGQSSPLGEATADDHGTASTTFTVPTGLAKGTHTINAVVAGTDVASAPLQILEGKNKKKNKGKGKGKGGKDRKSQRGNGKR